MIVKVLPLPAVVILLPPAIVRVSLSISIVNVPPLSPAKFKSSSLSKSSTVLILAASELEFDVISDAIDADKAPVEPDIPESLLDIEPLSPALNSPPPAVTAVSLVDIDCETEKNEPEIASAS